METPAQKSTSSPQNRVMVGQSGICIPDGDTGASNDLTLMNEHLILKFATETRPPWGMPPGGVLDIAAVVQGRPQLDLVNLFDFLPDNWCSWPNTYHRVQAVVSGPKRGVVRVERDWGDVHLVTAYTLVQGENAVHVATTMTHAGTQPYDEIFPGYTLYLKGGYMFTPPGLSGIKQGPADGALTWSFIGYDEQWAIALHAPYVQSIDHFGQDMFGRISLQPGESKTIQAWLQLCPHSSIAEILRFEMEQRNLRPGTIQGRVTDDAGSPVDQPYIVVEQQGHPLTWCQGSQGRYALQLPEGIYRIHATAKHFAQSASEDVSISPGQILEKDFFGLESPAQISFQARDSQDQTPVDARISIEKGPTPVIGFLGQSRYFTDLERVGFSRFSLPPGSYLFHVSHGDGFISLPKEVQIDLQAKESRDLDIDIELMVRPWKQGWFAADLHHHGDVLDGVTPPDGVLRSELAAGLDFAFLSDHDSTEKNDHMALLADKRGMPFIPAMEISPAWGHFNVYPVTSAAELSIDPGSSTAGQIFAEARKLGAEVIVVNHPYSTYGYFRSLDLGVAPGGFAQDFDLLELNYQYSVKETVHKLWELWNQGVACYLTAGTDTHSIWQDRSGAVRMYVHLDSKPTPAGFIAALKSGHAFATFGPLVFPEIVFGREVNTKAGQPFRLAYDIVAVEGIKTVDLIHNGQVQDSIQETQARTSREASFSVCPEQDGWYALVVADRKNNQAFTNPVWVKVNRG